MNEPKPEVIRRRKRVSARPSKEFGKISWSSLAAFVGMVDREDGRRLAVNVQPVLGEWGVLAVEIATDAVTPNAILDNHAHKEVGHYDSVKEAMFAAESFAQSWYKGHKAAQMSECGCEEIHEGPTVLTDPRELVEVFEDVDDLDVELDDGEKI